MSDPQPGIDPYKGFRFRLQIDGAVVAAFSEAAVPMSADPIAVREAVPNLRLSPSASTALPTLTLRRGMACSFEVYDWFNQSAALSLADRSVRKDATLTLTDENGQCEARWILMQAWPTRFESSGIGGDNDVVLIETLELMAEVLTRQG